MADGPIPFLIIGALLLALSWPGTLLHMKLLKIQWKAIFGVDLEKYPKFMKWYKRGFFTVVVLLAVMILIVHGLRLFGVTA